MRFYSGFCLRNESGFFADRLKTGEYTVSGFSYGTIRALEYALQTPTRLDTLQLFSPAYFCNKPDSFKRLQLKGYRRDGVSYRSRFIESCFAPYPVREVEVVDDGEAALQTLLTYDWPENALRTLHARGVGIEVYLGGKDAVIDAEAARAYFTPHATVFYFKDANHFLLGE